MEQSRLGRAAPWLNLLAFGVLVSGLIRYSQSDWRPESGCGAKYLTFLAAPALALAGLAAAAFRAGARGNKSQTPIVFRVLGVAVLLVAFVLCLPPWMFPFRSCDPPSNESLVTVGCLPELNNAIAAHVALHGSVPTTLKDLGVAEPRLGYSLLGDLELLNGQKAGYLFTYAPGPPEADGTRKRYTIVARPIRFGETGAQNFFIDESGVRRFTAEDRPATVNDCPVENWDTCKR